MCGICGKVAFASETDPVADRRRVEAMLLSLSHRGPDDVGLVSAPSAVLGVTRLAIRGVRDGNQPMCDPESGVVAVCNGEIDNHQELRAWLAERGRPVQQATDVAVIPGLYLELGEAFVDKLIGAFALAIWHPQRRRLMLARDRAGERPLFFAPTPNGVIFATEIAALVAQGRLPVTLAPEATGHYLQFGIFPSPMTPFTEIQKVAPGQCVEINATETKHRSYWRWNITGTAKRPAVLDDFDRLFRAAVQRQSEVEVDFGVFLSGGVDSSLVSAVTRSLHPKRKLKAFTLRFEEESYDEGDFAVRVARQLGMELIPVWVRPEEVRACLPMLLRVVGEPLADPAWLPTTLLAQRAAQEVKLALVGEGADELFGGYPTYIGAGVAERYARLPVFLRAALRRLVEALPPSEKKVTISFLLKRFVQGTELSGMARHRLWLSNIAPAILERLGVSPPILPDDSTVAPLLLDRLQQWDLETSLAEGLLTKADRASMSSALELRSPFLDLAVMDFAATLPPADRVRGLATKTFLKRYATRYLPRAIVYRRKRGLSVPIGRWLRGPFREWAEAALGNPRLEQVGIRTSATLSMLGEHTTRQADHARALWTLIVLSEWLDWAARETVTTPRFAET